MYKEIIYMPHCMCNLEGSINFRAYIEGFGRVFRHQLSLKIVAENIKKRNKKSYILINIQQNE